MGAQMSGQSSKARVERRSFVAALMREVPKDTLVVTGLGSPTYDVFAAGDRDENYYLWGAMGGTVPMALGIALAQPGRAVLVVTGDGEQLMGIGSLATVGAKQPKNLGIVVLDNGHFGETGMQKSHTSLGTDLVAVARACSIADAFAVHEPIQVSSIAERLRSRVGPFFAQTFIQASEQARALPPRDGPYIKNRFRAALGLKPF